MRHLAVILLGTLIATLAGRRLLVRRPRASRRYLAPGGARPGDGGQSCRDRAALTLDEPTSRSRPRARRGVLLALLLAPLAACGKKGPAGAAAARALRGGAAIRHRGPRHLRRPHDLSGARRGRGIPQSERRLRLPGAASCAPIRCRSGRSPRRSGRPPTSTPARLMRARLRQFLAAFADQQVLVCYALKANSNLAVIRTLADEGAGAEVVSGGELRARARGRRAACAGSCSPGSARAATRCSRRSMPGSPSSTSNPCPS